MIILYNVNFAEYRLTHMKSSEGIYKYSLQQARDACASAGAALATLAQLKDAYRQGYGFCRCGWLDNGTAGYVVQWPENACGGKNVASRVHTCNWRRTWDAYCFK